MWVCDPIVASPVAAISARPDQLTGWPSSGNGAPRSTKSVDDVERRRQVPLDEGGQHHIGPVGGPVVEREHDLRRAGDSVGG